MAVEVKIQAFVLRKNISDYPQSIELETATNAIAKTLTDISRKNRNRTDCESRMLW